MPDRRESPARRVEHIKDMIHYLLDVRLVSCKKITALEKFHCRAALKLNSSSVPIRKISVIIVG